VKDEPVEVKMDVDDVNVDNDGDFDVKQEQNDTPLMSSSTSRVKPEPVEEGIPDSERLRSSSLYDYTDSKYYVVRVKLEQPELEVRVKDEPVGMS
jgi:hypothetical protein